MTEAQRRPRTVLAVVAVGNFVQLGARMVIGPLVPLILEQFTTTKAAVGLVLTGMWAVYALLQFPSGVFADRYGEREVLLVGLGGTAVGAGLVALAPSFPLFGLAVLVLGAGAGLYFAPASALLSRLYEDRGSALGALTAGGAVAGLVYPAVGSAVGVRTDWRVAVALAAGVALPVLATSAIILPRLDALQPGVTVTDAVSADRIRELLGRRRVAYTTVLAVTFGFTFQALSSFFATFLVEFRDLDPATAGLAYGAVFALSSLAQPVAGRLSDRRSRDLALAGSATLAGTGLLVLLSVPGTVGTVAGTAVLGVGVSWPGVIQARFMDQLSDAERGFGFGLVRSTYMLLAAAGSVVVGTLADVAGWLAGYGFVVALLAAGLAILGANRALGLDL